MYVIFPADELILMTYGAVIPRISARPTLDCLREPQVPLAYPSSTTLNTSKKSNPQSFERFFKTNNNDLLVDQQPEQTPLLNSLPGTVPISPTSRSFQTFTYNFEEAPIDINQNQGGLPQNRIRRTSRASLTHPFPAPSSSTGKRSSVRSKPRSRPPTPPVQISQPQKILQKIVTAKPPTPPLNQRSQQLSTAALSTSPSQMYNDASMRASQQQQQQQQQTSPSNVNQRFSSTRSGTPQRSYDPNNNINTNNNATYDNRLSAYSGIEYPTGALQTRRDRSPSIVLEPPTPSLDPTRPLFAEGWGRPMSPMELPPEPHYHSHSNKSPTSKGRLRPKLHIPLGKLGRSSSTDQKESQRLREDLHIQVENPIFNSENLRQRNFDAFFESGEPVYKLQPKNQPSSAPADGASTSYASLPPLDNYAGVYDSLPRGKSSKESSLFSRSSKEDKTLSSRSKSSEQFPPSRETRAASVSGSVPQKDSSGKSSSGLKSRSFFGWRGSRGGSLSPQASMASSTGVLKDYGHTSLNEAFKSQNNVNFKLIKTVSDFSETLSHLYEEHATALQTLVSTYRKKNGELRKERPACHLSIFQAWETFLQEVETDSQASNDVANVLSRQVSRPMLDKSFHRKVQSRKIFTHRESFETIIAKTEEKLSKCRLDYKQCHMAHRQNPTQVSLTEYIDAHNAYVQQLHATNAMLEAYHIETVPQLMLELEEIHNDLYSIITDSILQGADVLATKATDQAKRYSNLTSQCTAVSPSQDLTSFVRTLPLTSQAQKVPRRIYAPPTAETEEPSEYNEMTPFLRNELVFDRHSTLSLRPALESLKREAIDLELQIRQLQDAIDSLNRTQVRGLEGQLYNKVNEMQEDLSMKKFDIRAKQLHLAAIKAQKELFVSKVEPSSPRAERKYSAATAPSMKTKWLKAFKSLKPAAPDRRNGAAGTTAPVLRPNEDGTHHLQEYTYKKITACDVCSQILRGHTRQGLRCRICKLNAHGDCASQLPRCQPKQKLLRRQKSTSEIENRIDVEEETPLDASLNEPVVVVKNQLNQYQNQIQNQPSLPLNKFRQKIPTIERIAQLEITEIDQIYRVLKQAGELKNIAAEKSVQSKAEIATTPGQEIPIVNIPEYPERNIGATGGLISAAAIPPTAVRAQRPGIRSTAIAMPILGVQLQQQELQQQRSALPVPPQDVSSSSDYQISMAQVPSVANMSTAAYLNCGIGINYYTNTKPTNMAGAVAGAAVLNTPGATIIVPPYRKPSLTQQQQREQPTVYQQLQKTPPQSSKQSRYNLQHQQSLPQSILLQDLYDHQQLTQQHPQPKQQPAPQSCVADPSLRRRLFAGFRPLSGFGRSRSRSSQNRSISLPETPHSPRRQKLNLRMKSLSLDSPESSELHGQIRRRQQPIIGPTTSAYYHGGSGGHLEHSTPPSNNSRLHSPSSPSHQGRKLLYASRGMRGGSVDLPDEMEKSQSSASTSPCPSPVRYFQKSHRLLPTNLYVILYNFKARHPDELDLKAGYKVTVIDTSDPDWWKGKFLGRVGFFPSKYCVRVNANEKPLQVTHNLQVSDGERGENMTLLRDQIVIQCGEEMNGMVMVRSADNRQGYCPVKYLQEV